MYYLTSKIRAVLRPWQLLYLTLGALIAIGLWFSIDRTATAHHPKGDGARHHVYSQHRSDVTEWWCSDSHYTNGVNHDLSETNMHNRVHNALTANGYGDWDMNARIDIAYNTTTPCDQILTVSTRALMRLEYHGRESGQAELADVCGRSDVSCAVGYDLIDSNGNGSVDSGCRVGLPSYDNCRFDETGSDRHADYYFLNLQSNWLGANTSTSAEANKKWRHVINHETGHAFGLLDPPQVTNPNSPYCLGNNSVMEKKFFYNCGDANNNKAWPTQYDLNEVIAINSDTDHSGTYGAEDDPSSYDSGEPLPDIPYDSGPDNQ